MIDDEELIVGAAVRTPDGLLFAGTRHDECYKAAGRACGAVISIQAEAGFITNKCRFLNRKDAFIFALAAGQIESPELFSEDIFPPFGNSLF